jgi:hypothetical protein
MPDIPRLVCRPHPYPDESLLSYLVRLQVANGYDRLHWLTGGLRAWMGRALPARLVTTDDVDFLAALAACTEVSTSTLYRMTLNRYAEALLPPGTPARQVQTADGSVLAFTGQLRRLVHRLHTDQATPFCPTCLVQARYHRLCWLLIPVFACVEHGCWLRETCAGCGRPVSIVSVSNGICQTCHSNLSAMPALPLDPFTETAQRALHSLLECGQLPLADGLPELSVPACFRLLDGLITVVRQLGWGWVGQSLPASFIRQPFPAGARETLSVQQWGALYSSAWDALQDWPRRFEALLSAFRQQSRSYPGGGIQHELGNFYTVWLEKNWNHPDLAVVQTAFNQYFVTHFPPSREMVRLKRIQRFPELRQQFAYIDIRNAARTLGVSPPKITRMVRDGYIRVYPQRDASRPGRFVYRADLEAALTECEAVLDYRGAAAELQTTPPVIHDWVEAGLLQQSATRCLDGKAIPVLCRADVAAFRQRLAWHVQHHPERPADPVNLKKTCARNGKVGLKAVQVLERVLAGKLPAYHPDPELQPFGDLWFAAADVAALTQQVKDENGWVGFLEVWRRFPVSRETVHLWIAQRHLIPVATFARAQYFDRTQVEQFQQSLLTSKVAMRYLETSRSALSLWVRAGFLPVVSGLGAGTGRQYFFHQAELEAFRQRYITPSELRRRSGDAFWSSCCRAVRAKQLHTFPDGQRARVYLRAEVEAFALTLGHAL